MTNIDQFESAFKAADKKPFNHEWIDIRSVLVLADADAVGTEDFAASVKRFLVALADRDIQWKVKNGADFSRVGQLLALVEEIRPDLICTYRNLHLPATEYPHSLGVYVDVLTQVTAVPVLLMPRPGLPGNIDTADRGTRHVMAITDHLAGDHHLVSFAAEMTQPGGTLHLTHVEDDATFARYIDTISRIPTIDTDDARNAILEQLLKEPRDYVDSCRKLLEAEGLPLTVETIVAVGHHLTDYRRLIKEHGITLLVLNTKDEDQLAMHGLAYPLIVELRDTPMLLL